MKIENGKITRATEAELYEYWLRSDWCEIMCFKEYMRRCSEAGTEIIQEGGGSA